jgi:serine/threonine protein kinase
MGNNQYDGGSYIESGTYGCVFSPHLKCRGVKNIPKSVGKVFNKARYADEEARITKKVTKDIDPKGKFTLPVLAQCDIDYFRQTDQVNKCPLIKPGVDINTYKQIVYPHAGKSLEDVLNDRTRMRGSPATFLKLLKLFRPILEGLGKFTDHQLIHNDIKPNNIMYTKGKLYLIDFGRLTHHDEMFTRAMVPFLIDDKYWYAPECKAFVHPRSSGAEALYRGVMRNFAGCRYLIRALSTHLRMNPLADLEAFFNAQVPQKQYKNLFAGKIDMYSLGFVIIDLYLWSEYHEQIYKTNSPKAVIREMVINLIRGMVQFDPRKRSTSEDALAQLDDIFKLMDCLKRPTAEVKRSPSAHGQKPKTKLNICVGKLMA